MKTKRPPNRDEALQTAARRLTAKKRLVSPRRANVATVLVELAEKIEPKRLVETAKLDVELSSGCFDLEPGLFGSVVTELQWQR